MKIIILWTHNPLVVGSSPTGPTIFINKLGTLRHLDHPEIVIYLAVVLAVKVKVHSFSECLLNTYSVEKLDNLKILNFCQETITSRVPSNYRA